MEKWKTKFKSKKNIANGTLEFVFERPSGFEYLPGQHVILNLDKLPFEDKRGGRRPLTLSSAPFENELSIATRISDSGFKQSLLKYEKGNPLEIWGPRGDFFSGHKNRPLCFLAGGIGIAPFNSIIKELSNQSSDHQIFLFYSNRTVQDAAYHEEYNLLAQQSSRFVYRPIFTQKDGHMLDKDYFVQEIKEPDSVEYFLCGPPGFVAGMKEQLEILKINVDQIHEETFFGY